MSNLTEPEKKILDAAKKVFELYGYSGARMQQIADEAGISKASLHYYFRSKEKLFDHIFEETMAEFLPLISTWEDDSEDWEKKLREFISSFFSFLKTKSLLFILREINRNPDLLLLKKKDTKQKKNKFITYFEKLQESGKIKNMDVRLIYIFLHSLCAYPILNSVLFKMSTNMNDKEFDNFMDEYPEFVADFLITALKKQKHK
jgi:TetR/AcrR family transcriptional regulator